jgi:hypothetical protein
LPNTRIPNLEIVYVNTGTAPWWTAHCGPGYVPEQTTIGTAAFGSLGRDHESQLYDSSTWIDNEHPTCVAASSGSGGEVLPNQAGTFVFSIVTPSTLGPVEECWELEQYVEAWDDSSKICLNLTVL